MAVVRRRGTLIGAGAHAHDIAATRKFRYWYSDHRRIDGPLVGPVIVGINDPRTRYEVACALVSGTAAWVHPDAQIGPLCSWGPGTHINYGVSMTRTSIGRYTTVSPGVTICGDVTIGNRVLIGAGATVCDRVTVGDDATVGAGAVVLPETVIPAGETWVGVPAKRI